MPAFAGHTTEFAGFDTVIVLRRSPAIFILKNLLPVISSRARRVRDAVLPRNVVPRTGDDPRTAILTSAVLLLAVDNQLGDVGYTVAVERIFYRLLRA